MFDEYIPEKMSLKVLDSPTIICYHPSEDGKGPRINVIHLGNDLNLNDAPAYFRMSEGRFPAHAVNSLYDCLIEADKKKEL